MFRSGLRIVLLAGTIGVSIVPFSGRAQQQPGQLTPQQFQANPAQVLANLPTGGSALISLIGQLAIADQADLPLIIGLLANAKPDQANAIGTGLGQAALVSVATNQAYAHEIQAALAAANNQTASLAYAAIMGDQAIGATGGGGGGGGGGPVGQSASSGGGGDGSIPSLSTVTRTTPAKLFTLNANETGYALGSTIATASVSKGVSPHGRPSNIAAARE